MDKLSRSDGDSKKIVYKYFNIFKLNGGDTLDSVDMQKSVEVKYNAGKPTSIKYYLPQRTVTLLFEETFNVNGVEVYVYSTSNFHGGQPGKNRVYSGLYEEHKDLIYVSKSDTILCQAENVPKDKNYLFYLYVKKLDGSIEEVTKGEFDYDEKYKTQTTSKLYEIWLRYLKNDYLSGKSKTLSKQQIPE